MELYVTLGKPSELYELYSIINHFSIKKVFFTITNRSRIDENIITNFLNENFSEVEVLFKPFIFKNKTPDDFYKFLSNFNEKIDIYALSLGYNRLIYKLSSKLKKQNKTIVHISDGVCHAFSLFGFILGFRTTNLFSFLKSIPIYFEYKKAIADYSFFSLYPNPCCFAKKTLPLEKRKLAPNKIEIVNNIKTLILPGWGLDINQLKETYNITDTYCATSKDKEININGEVIKLENYITGEDVIDFSKIERVVGTPSTVLIYAKTNYPNLQVDCILTGVLNKTFGLFYEREYMKLGKRLGINFIKNKID